MSSISPGNRNLVVVPLGNDSFSTVDAIRVGGVTKHSTLSILIFTTEEGGESKFSQSQCPRPLAFATDSRQWFSTEGSTAPHTPVLEKWEAGAVLLFIVTITREHFRHLVVRGPQHQQCHGQGFINVELCCSQSQQFLC